MVIERVLIGRLLHLVFLQCRRSVITVSIASGIVSYPKEGGGLGT